MVKTDDGVIGMKYEWVTIAYSWNSKLYCLLLGQYGHCTRETMANDHTLNARVTLSSYHSGEIKHCLNCIGMPFSLSGFWG